MEFCPTPVCGCESLWRSLSNTVFRPNPIKVKGRIDVNTVRIQQGWKSYISHPATFTDICEKTVYLLYRYSLQLVLNPSWRPTSMSSKSLKLELYNVCLTTTSMIVHKLCHRLKQIVNRPWKHPILIAILCRGVVELDVHAVDKYLRDEGEAMIWTRLKVLCETPEVTAKLLHYGPQRKLLGDNSISPALSYVSEVLRYLTIRDKFRDVAHSTDVLCAGSPLDIQDAFIALLAREGKIDAMRHYMYENMSLDTVSNMRERIRNWPGHLPPSLAIQASTVDFHANEVSTGMALSQGRVPMLKQVGWELALGYTDPVACSKARARRASALAERARNLASAESQPVNIFILANRLSRMKYCPEYRSICIELYLMGLKLEHSRRMDSKSAEAADKQATINPILASVFGRLAKLFNTQWLVKRELLLTAFSLQPNRQWLKQLLVVARQSGKTCSARGCTMPFSDSWCQDTAAHILCYKCGRFGTHGNVHSSSNLGSLVWFPLPEHVLETNLTDPPRCHMLDNKSLGIKKDLAEQLVSLVSAFRYKELSWVLEWSKLYIMCVNYMNAKDRTHKKNDDLTFLKIDLPLYQCLREDNKIVAVKRKRSDEECTDSDDERLKHISDQETEKININTYCFYKSRIDIIDYILSDNNISTFSPQTCFIFDVEDTATGFARLCEIRRAMVKLYDKSTEEILAHFKRKAKEIQKESESSNEESESSGEEEYESSDEGFVDC